MPLTIREAVDFYRVDEWLTDEERSIRELVRTFVEEQCFPIIVEHDRAGTFPAHLIPQMAEIGMLGANLDGYGCAGMGAVAYGVIMEELERCDSGLRSFVSVQGSLCMYPIHRYGSEAQKERWLPAMAAGRAIGCFGLTEHDFGSDPGGMRCRAEETADGFVLNGAKMWITNGSVADVAVVFAKLDGEVRGFLVEKGTPGFIANDVHGKFSLRASVTSELVFDDCHIPRENALPGARGLGAPLSCLNQARYGISWGGLGAAEFCFEEALRYAQGRVQFGKPIASFQLVQQKLVTMVSEITKGKLLALRIGRLKEAGKVTPAQISLAKRNNVHVGLESARMARDILGAVGITDEFHCGRHMRNLESVYTYEGTHDIHTLIIGREITGCAAFGNE
ncbi:MAG: acyl-CoA dehydrogenase family protein [Candidatus Schekmanbacteria bacterium]|nr:acyl-CoA dehydrogenase family protein [Candidatus Schekmanbacteria bacterium]